MGRVGCCWRSRLSFVVCVGYLLGAQSDPWLIDAAVLPLILIPLAFGYSVVRYRLMDVELLFAGCLFMRDQSGKLYTC